MSDSLASRIATAAECPIGRCVRMRDLFDLGIGHVIATRQPPSHALNCAFFLVDAHCLGVKQVYHRELTPLDFDETFDALRGKNDFVDMDPACARKLLRDAVAYAGKAELLPAKDYFIVEKILGDFNADRCVDRFDFGKDGKPFFVAGPGDTPARVREVMTALAKHYGPGEWDYVVPIPTPHGPDDDELLLENDSDADRSAAADQPLPSRNSR